MKRFVMGLVLMLQAPVAPAPQPPPVYQDPTFTDLKWYYAECSADVRKMKEHMQKQDAYIAESGQYIKQLEAENAELKKATKKQ